MCKDGICSGDRIELIGMDTTGYLRGLLRRTNLWEGAH